MNLLSSPTDSRVSILLVDDRPENLIALSAILDTPDYRLVQARSGQEALRCLLSEDFALILLDVRMPGMDGFETARMIKQRERSKYIPIIFITAVNLETSFLFKGYDAGAVDYIVKPFDSTILRSKVAVFADLHRKNELVRQQASALRHHERLEREQEVARRELEILRREKAVSEKYRDLVEGIRDGIVWTANPETLEFSLISSHASRIIGETNAQEAFTRSLVAERSFQQALVRIRNGAFKDATFEHRLSGADGESLWFQTHLRLGESEVPGQMELRGLSINVTRIKAAQEEADRAVQVRDEFLSIASHEIRTPLTPLRLKLELMQRMVKAGIFEAPQIAKLTAALDKSCYQVDRLARLTDELLDVSRINGGKFTLMKEPVELSDVVKDVCDRFKGDLSRSGCELRLALASARGLWDRLKVEQVVINLLTNALKYGEAKPIEISTGEQDGMALLRIRDHGIGIREEDHERIFTLYERAVSPMNYGGLGLGLYIVKKIAEAHGGNVVVQSKPRDGAVFTVQLPFAEASVMKQAQL